jgi:N-acyl homoserine lactone hydrolase
MLAPSVLLPDALRQAGADPGKLTWFIPSHAHIDHVGGLVDLPRLPPVLLPAEEIAFIGELGERWSVQVVPAHARLLNGRMTAMAFEPKPYETFDAHLDVFGDGAIVAVKLPGHTPGSVAVFVNLTPERRLLHAGDSVNDQASLERRAGKPLFQRQWNHDQAAADGAIARLAQLHALVPSLSVLPAHDRTAWQRVFGTPRCID